MKMSRRDRKIFNQGKSLGYSEGYAKGLYDGNPFNKFVEALSNFADSMANAIKENPELLKSLNTESLEDTEEAETNEDARENFHGICPYTNIACDWWKCSICEVEKQERKFMEGGGED